MKKFILYLYFFFIVFVPAASLKAADFTVPFQNISLSSGSTITADYSFGLHAIIFCFEDTLTNGDRINWTFKGKTQSGNLPIFLKTKSNFEGEFADPNGTITIFNNASDAVVSCLFGY